MPTISERIDSILDRRLGRGLFQGQGRLHEVEERINKLRIVKDRINELDALIATISTQIEQKQGEYFDIFVKDPEAISLFKNVSCNKAKNKLDQLLAELEDLKKRFEREALRIAFIGYERQGKSTFLQSMTGLPNEIIPAYDGTSCTGAVSIIHNTDAPLRVEIEFCTAAEFIDNLKSKLKGLFPDRTFIINNLEDIRKIDISGYEGDDALEVQRMINEKMIGHLDDYSYLLGSGIVTYDDKDVIMEHVAQYREYEEIPEGEDPDKFIERVKERDENYKPTKIVYRKPYYKYLAVKSVNIYCPFLNQDCGKIEFVDTIGLGASVNAEGIEREMFRVLREDCDAAIDVFCPSPTGGALDQRQRRIFNKIKEQMGSRSPRLWMAYAINGIPNGDKANIQNIPDIKAEMAAMGETHPFGFYTDVNAADRKDVNEKLLVPVLELITKNLESLDQALVDKVDALTKETYNECLNLVQSANEVTSSSTQFNSDVLTLFVNKLYPNIKTAFTEAMNEIDLNGYAKKREEKCTELEDAYKVVIDNLYDFVKDEEVILRQFQTGALLTPGAVFEEHIEQIRNDIFTAFENVNANVLYPLQEKVKTDLIEILYEKGLMKNLPTVIDSPSKEWLQSIIDNYVDEKSFPHLHKALRFILDYQINIEGLVEYNVTKSLYIIDRTHKNFIGYCGGQSDVFEEKASFVWQELMNSIRRVQKNLRTWIDEFALIPSHSFYSRVHKFYIKVLTDKGGVEDFDRFYRSNMGIIWSDEISASGQAQKAFGDWTNRTKNLQDIINSKTFNIK